MARSLLEFFWASGGLVQGDHVERISQVLQNDTPKAAILALGKLAKQVPFELFVTVLQNDEDKLVRAAARLVLEMLGQEVPIEPLGFALSDVPKQVREATIQTRLAQVSRLSLEVLTVTLKMGEWHPVRMIATLLRRSVSASADEGVSEMGRKRRSTGRTKSRNGQQTRSRTSSLVAEQFAQMQMLDWAKQN